MKNVSPKTNCEPKLLCMIQYISISNFIEIGSVVSKITGLKSCIFPIVLFYFKTSETTFSITYAKPTFTSSDTYQNKVKSDEIKLNI